MNNINTTEDSRNKNIKTIFEKKRDLLLNLLGSESKIEKFTSHVIRLSNDGNLAKCDYMSIVGAAMQVAYLGLELDNTLGQAYVLARYVKKQNKYIATFQIGYKGLVALLLRSNQVKSITPIITYENEPFKFEFNSNGLNFSHSPLPPSQRGNRVGAYVQIQLKNGGIHTEYMWEEEILEVKKLSDSADSQYSPWNSSEVSKDAMYKKTVLKRACKLLPLSTEVAEVVYLEDAQERGYVDYSALTNNGQPVVIGNEYIDLQPQTLEQLGLSTIEKDGKLIVDGKTFGKTEMLKNLGFKYENKVWCMDIPENQTTESDVKIIDVNADLIPENKVETKQQIETKPVKEEKSSIEVLTLKDIEEKLSLLGLSTERKDTDTQKWLCITSKNVKEFSEELKELGFRNYTSRGIALNVTDLVKTETVVTKETTEPVVKTIQSSLSFETPFDDKNLETKEEVQEDELPFV